MPKDPHEMSESEIRSRILWPSMAMNASSSLSIANFNKDFPKEPALSFAEAW